MYNTIYTGESDRYQPSLVTEPEPLPVTPKETPIVAFDVGTTSPTTIGKPF